ncbi:hypothetical protein [Streptomyces rubellomurinus]|uniref:Uncharacterized protein n=1 Tax=Streptomyces rubellomurinus (strain ATCC 31215) TaxID=359131 RepID=A0A0F2T7V0_STRR3|nr:hypothetical protein [Streptomyces rubellomurinus]KJS59309.1 hypothetical protein VM95_27975 [Streptomyces rubellomurinus]
MDPVHPARSPEPGRVPRALPAVLTVALPLLGLPLAATALLLLSGAAHRTAPTTALLASLAAALLDHLDLGVLQPYAR